MTLDLPTYTALVRTRLGVSDNDHDPAILFVLPQALRDTARRIAANPRKRHLLMTDKDGTPILLTGNVVDLTDYNKTAGKVLLLEYFHYGNVFISTNSYPLLEIDAAQFNAGIASHPFASSFVFYWLDGHLLRLSNLAGTFFGEETIKINAPYTPSLAQLSDIPELHADLIDKAAELVLGQGNDAMEDDR